MGVRFPGFGNNTIVNVTPVTNNETIIAQSAPLSPSLDFAQVFIFWMALVQIFAAQTGIIYRIRRGSLVTSPLVNVGATLTVTANTTTQFSGVYVDTPGAVASLQYTLTYQAVAATGNSTVTDVSMLAFAL